MPVKRRKLGAIALHKLTMAQRAHLVTGYYFFDFAGERDHFADDGHRRQAWSAYREELMAEHDRVGQRPLAFWQYDAPGGWQAHGESEQDGVRTLLLAGSLEHCRRDGTIPVANEVAAIEDQWRNEIRVTLLGSRDPARPREIAGPLTPWGTPRWFYREHAPGIAAELAAEAARWRAARRAVAVNGVDGGGE
jgi:hypothetical protein